MRCLHLLLAIGLIQLAPRRAQAQTEEERLDGYEVKPGFVGGLCGELRRPCGWEAAKGHSVHKLKPFKSKRRGKMKEVLDDVVSRNPEYQWSKANGVINIRPKAESRDLDKVISNLSINDMTIKDARQKLCEAASLKCKWRIEAGPRQHFAKITLDLKNVSVRDALNRMVEADGMASWSVEYDEKSGQPIIDFACWRKGPSLWTEEDRKKR